MAAQGPGDPWGPWPTSATPPALPPPLDKRQSCQVCSTSQKLTSTSTRRQQLKLPPGKFWPEKAYEKTFGDYRAPENKHRGHRRTKIAKWWGIYVPADFSIDDGPWDVDNLYIDDLSLEETLNEQTAGEPVDIPGELQAQFDDMNEEADETVRKACTGMSYKDLMNEIAEKEEEALQKKKKKEEAEQATEAEGKVSAGKAQALKDTSGICDSTACCLDALRSGAVAHPRGPS